MELTSRTSSARIIDFAAYRAANPRQQPLPGLSRTLLAWQPPRSTNARTAAHRVVMLRHLQAVAAGRA